MIAPELLSVLSGALLLFWGWIAVEVYRTRVVVERLSATLDNHESRITKVEGQTDEFRLA